MHGTRRIVVGLLVLALVVGLLPGPWERPADANSDDTFHLRNANRAGAADISFTYGRPGDTPLTGDWNGDGRRTIGIVRGRTFHLRNANRGGAADISFTFGREGDIPIAGDWNGDGTTTIGIVRGRTFHLRNANRSGAADISFTFGREGDIPITGDWNGNGDTTVGIVRGDHFHLRNQHGGGAADHTFRYGRSGDIPITGDWNGNGGTTVGIVRHPPPARTSCDGGAWDPQDTEVVGFVAPPTNLDQNRPRGDAADLAREALLNANRFALGHHYDVRYSNREQDTYADVLGDFSRTERSIRMPSSTALSVAISLRTNAYSASAVGQSEQFAYDYVTWLTRSVACQHKSITSGGWGDTWQSAFWAYLAGKAGWLVWEHLEPEDRFYVARMVEYEANRFLDYQVPYWKDADGAEVHEGDSKAEENSWNANVLQVATAMMPNHPNWNAWQHKNIQLLLSSYSTPEDLDDHTLVHGQPLSAWLDGWNVNSDGTVVNHGIINPDYMSTIHQNWSAAMTYGLADMETPQAAFHNADLVYGALANDFYQEDDPLVRFPDGFSWGRNRPGVYFNIDSMADAFGRDAAADRPADYWEDLRIREQLRLQNRPDFGDGRTYVEPRPAEDRYSGREEYIAQILSFGWLAKYIAEHVRPEVTDRNHALDIPAPLAEPQAVPPPDEEEDASP